MSLFAHFHTRSKMPPEKVEKWILAESSSSDVARLSGAKMVDNADLFLLFFLHSAELTNCPVLDSIR